jgi:anthranilate synthase component 1
VTVLTHQLPLDLDLLSLHQDHPDRYPHLLESVSGGRYDILFAFPELDNSLVDRGDKLFVDLLDHQYSSRYRPRQTELPFEGGWFLYLAYELAQELEPVLGLYPDAMGLPRALAVYCPAAFIRDREESCIHLVAEQQGQIETMRADIQMCGQGPIENTPVELESLNEDQPERFLDGVLRIKEYIREGDVFQVNLSRAWNGYIKPGVTHARLYAALRHSNPAPFAAMFTLGEDAILSSSPERLVSVRNGVIETRPIAGTRPRGQVEQQDRDLSEELLAHPKEQAEHIMLIDLERNDLGRICEAGSVEVNELMVLESYQHVHHIVSNIRGRLRDEVTPGQVIRAVFPGGTITGCPKIRCMEIIAELEQEGRGAYTGSVGYLNANGDMDLNILIRTLVRSGDRLQFRTGAGIVNDSDPQHELEETRHKAEGLLRGLKL